MGCASSVPVQPKEVIVEEVPLPASPLHKSFKEKRSLDIAPLINIPAPDEKTSSRASSAAGISRASSAYSSVGGLDSTQLTPAPEFSTLRMLARRGDEEAQRILQRVEEFEADTTAFLLNLGLDSDCFGTAYKEARRIDKELGSLEVKFEQKKRDAKFKEAQKISDQLLNLRLQLTDLDRRIDEERRFSSKASTIHRLMEQQYNRSTDEGTKNAWKEVLDMFIAWPRYVDLVNAAKNR